MDNAPHPIPEPPEGNTMLQFPIPAGTVIAQGTVLGMTLTAYEVEGPNGTTFVPFTKVHGLTPATPLVIFR